MLGVRIEQNELGPRLYVGRARLHHYQWGIALIGVGVYMIAVDRRDLAAALRRTPGRPFPLFDPEVIGVTTSSRPDGW